MFASFFKARDHLQKLGFAMPSEAITVLSRGLPSVSVLVDHQGVHFFQRLQGFGIAHRMPSPAPPAVPTMMDIGVARPSAKGRR